MLSVVDLARFGASLDTRHGVPEVLPAALHSYMTTDDTPTAHRIGTAWYLQTQGGLRRWDHAGHMVGTAAYLAVREDGLTVAAVYNRAGDDTFFNAFLEHMYALPGTVGTWPERDLFHDYVP